MPETERLILRKFTENDADALFQILSSQEVTAFLPMFPLQSTAEARLYIEAHDLRKGPQACLCCCAVCLKSDQIPIGYIQVSGDESHDLGYGLRKEFWHQGIITEAGKAVVEEMKLSGVPYLTATHDINNPRSGAVMKKLGMTYQYSYEELWQPKNIPVIFRMYQINLDGRSDRVFRKYWDRSSIRFVEARLNS